MLGKFSLRHSSSKHYFGASKHVCLLALGMEANLINYRIPNFLRYFPGLLFLSPGFRLRSSKYRCNRHPCSRPLLPRCTLRCCPHETVPTIPEAPDPPRLAPLYPRPALRLVCELSLITDRNTGSFVWSWVRHSYIPDPPDGQ